MKKIISALLGLALTHLCAYYIGLTLNDGEESENRRVFTPSDYRSGKFETLSSSRSATQRNTRRVSRDKKSAEFASALFQLRNESLGEIEQMHVESILFSDWLEHDWKEAIRFKYQHAPRFRGATATLTKFMVENSNQVMATAMDLEFGLNSTAIIGDLLRNSRATIDPGLLRDFLETSEGSFTQLAMYRYLPEVNKSSVDVSEIHKFISSFNDPALQQTAYEVFAGKIKDSAPEIFPILLRQEADELYMRVLMPAYTDHLSSQSVVEILEGCLSLPVDLRDSALNEALTGKTSRLAGSVRDTTRSIDDLIKHGSWEAVDQYGPEWLSAAISRGGDAVHLAEWALTLPPETRSVTLYTRAMEPFLKSNPYAAQEWIAGFELGWQKDYALAQLAFSTQDTAAWGKTGEWALKEISDPELKKQIVRQGESPKR